MQQRSIPVIVQHLRTAVGAAAIATLVLSGLLIGGPQPARAALVATGVNDSQSVKHDRTTVIPAPGVLGNDLNLLGGSRALLVSGVSHGTLTLRSDGGYTYTPAAGYLGTDTFRYRPSGLLSTAATVTITVTNATPVARPDAYSTAYRTTLVVPALGVLGNDTDADADALSAQFVGGGVSGSLSLGSNGGFTYSPNAGFSGTATFTYRVWDGVAWSAATTVALTVGAPPPTPTPTPSPAPTPTPPPPSPTPTPRPTPTPIVPLPTPSVSLPLPSFPLPTFPLPSQPSPTSPLPSQPQPGGSGPANPSPSSSPGGTAVPTSSATPGPGQSGDGDPTPSSSAGAPQPGGSGGAGGPAAPSGGGSTGAGSGDPEARFPSVVFDERRIDLAGASVGLLGGIEIWAVPAATIALPGLLVLIWVALQAAGAIAWVPAARRLKGKDDPRRRPRLRAS
ncbi:MAG TPA: Ig-like domain-containing protein [Candidatus Limnocylindrales bacterium]|nr:Ig-like domain-containing protein [Candidatus Limnocylindrales bacterium]